MPSPSKDMLLDWYRQMALIREFEETCHQLYLQKRITGVYLHLYSGHEASGVGSMAALRKSDHVITAYRDHGIALILGMDANAVMAEMMGKKTGSSGGKGGSMHLASAAYNFWGGYAIVGGHLPLAAGIALEARYRGKDDVTMTYVGDGATNNGYFHESLNMSAIWDLPVIWIIENNGYGMGTEVERASGQTELHRKAAAYGIKDFGRVDAQDALAVYEVASQAVAYARAHGPAVIEHITYRYRGHGVSDKQYDSRDDMSAELRQWMDEREPLKILRDRIQAQFGDVSETLSAHEESARQIVAQSVEFAEASDLPRGRDALLSNTYVGSPLVYKTSDSIGAGSD
ncbi:MAG: thiamine pyrophosphate-dependent enzyme [Chloroflexi bacterium]|nr:thiamine pyrophosphate-dependent enzyme [Chloroflexota bacterium]MCY3581148.1 thiamine pyrophosphate-dependent enzyme [Chloroflexota bacterium]MCY3715999.1 thiamine pyrophosphate-dependent enzyme [Chloroflexota bacterium]MXX83878.1 pyruvate dehydrogenase (acetyl-transferring) E1 component subunit alpha [Chloroflexota bacterium]MYE79641.1 pyruvate dehydrogenase (acetyl-transferring) E1 component subunit alpha [Chloroflexota bacterium]